MDYRMQVKIYCSKISNYYKILSEIPRSILISIIPLFKHVLLVYFPLIYLDSHSRIKGLIENSQDYLFLLPAFFNRTHARRARFLSTRWGRRDIVQCLRSSAELSTTERAHWVILSSRFLQKNARKKASASAEGEDV